MSLLPNEVEVQVSQVASFSQKIVIDAILRCPDVPPIVNTTSFERPVQVSVAKLPTFAVISFVLSPEPKVKTIFSIPAPLIVRVFPA